MATFHKRASGSWQAKVRRTGYPTQSRTFGLKGHAEAWARAVERKMDRGEFVEIEAAARKMTLGDALDRYEREVTPAKRGAAQERVRIAAWKSHGLARRAIATIRGHEIAAYRNERLAEGLSPNTVRLELAIISHLYSIARSEWGFEGLANPVKVIEKPAVATRATFHSPTPPWPLCANWPAAMPGRRSAAYCPPDPIGFRTASSRSASSRESKA